MLHSNGDRPNPPQLKSMTCCSTPRCGVHNNCTVREFTRQNSVADRAIRGWHASTHARTLTTCWAIQVINHRARHLTSILYHSTPSSSTEPWGAIATRTRLLIDVRPLRAVYRLRTLPAVLAVVVR